MKVKALAIAGALSVVSIALPLSAKAHVSAEEKRFFYATAAFATLCDLHKANAISTEIVQDFQRNWIKKIDDKFIGVMNQAIGSIRGKEVFKSCPLRRY